MSWSTGRLGRKQKMKRLAMFIPLVLACSSRPMGVDGQCSASCKLIIYCCGRCGDGIIDISEDCDDGILDGSYRPTLVSHALAHPFLPPGASLWLDEVCAPDVQVNIRALAKK